MEPYLGKGIKRLPQEADLIVIDPPYIPVPPWESDEHTAVDDPYKGTGLIREIIEEGIRHINPDNPEASIVMNYSSLAEAEVKEYLRAYGQLIEVETLSEGFPVPLKIERMDKRWIEWMKGRGLIVKEDAPFDGFKYWHTLKVVQIKPKKFSLFFKDGSQEITTLHNLALKSSEAKKWNNLTLRSKLQVLSLLSIEPRDYVWFDYEWRDLYRIVKYYQEAVSPLRKVISSQLKRDIHISPAKLLEPFYSLDKFFSANVIREIYFSGNYPYFLPEVNQTFRGMFNKAPQHIREALIAVFIENMKTLGWNQAITEYLQSRHNYPGSFSVADVTDASIGTGVYKITICLEEISDKPQVEMFLKRAHSPKSSLRNEQAYLLCEQLFLSNIVINSIPYYYHNSSGPDVLISPVIEKQSLDSAFAEALRSQGIGTERVAEVAVQQKLEFKPGVPEKVKAQMLKAEKTIEDLAAGSSARIRALRTIYANREFIKRSLVLKGMVDFHLHTIASDGEEAPAKVVFKAWLNGLEALAIVDHMAFGGIREALEAANKVGKEVEVICGIEFYSNGRDSQGRNLNIGKAHLVGYFPTVHNTRALRNLLRQMSKDPLYGKLMQIFQKRKENLEPIRRSFNELFYTDGLEISARDIQLTGKELLNFYDLAELLIKKYGKERLGVNNITEAKKKYFDKVKSNLPNGGAWNMNIDEILELIVRHNGVASLAHPAKYARNNKIRVRNVGEFLQKYAVVEVEGKKRFGMRAIGVYGAGNSKSEEAGLKEMIASLANKNEIYKAFPIIMLNESDYHGSVSREMVLGERDTEGYYSVMPQVANHSKKLDLLNQAALVCKIKDLSTIDLSAQERIGTVEKGFIEKAVMALAEHAVLGDILGRNDRHLANTRVYRNADGSIASMVDFDVANMLDVDTEGDNPGYLNYDWALEDVQQGVSEITTLTHASKFFQPYFK